MKVFSPQHFLRHISMPTLREFTDTRPLAAHLTIDWSAEAETLPAAICNAVAALQAALESGEPAAVDRTTMVRDLNQWFDDLRRAHSMANDLSLVEFLSACGTDPDVTAAFSTRDARERSMWMLTFRERVFRDAELRLAFLAKTNGKYWKKHRIEPGLAPTDEPDKLKVFADAVARLYKKEGCGDSTHIEVSHHPDNSIQLTIYVEGPITALAHFSDNNFQRVTTRIALETAVSYQPDTGIIESIVRGGALNHSAILKLFGKHVVGQDIHTAEIEKKRFRLNALRDGILEPFEDLSPFGVDRIRLRRARLTPRGADGVSFQIEASPEKDQDDAIRLALDALKVEYAFEAEYDMSGASVIVYMLTAEGERARHFSFDVYSSGSSTIKNLAQRNQPIAIAVLRALNVIDLEVTAE